MPSKRKKFNARFPPARIKKIMQTDEEVGKVAAPVPVIISRALELFIESLVQKTSEVTYGRNAKTLSCAHIKTTINSDPRFDFLKDLVANIPDIQPEDEEKSNGEHIKPKIRRPRKPREQKEDKIELKNEIENEIKNENLQSTDSDEEESQDDIDTEDTDSVEEQQPIVEEQQPIVEEEQQPIDMSMSAAGASTSKSYGEFT